MENTIHMEEAQFTVPQAARDYYNMRRADLGDFQRSLRELEQSMKDIKHALDQITKPQGR